MVVNWRWVIFFIKKLRNILCGFSFSNNIEKEGFLINSQLKDIVDKVNEYLESE